MSGKTPTFHSLPRNSNKPRERPHPLTSALLCTPLYFALVFKTSNHSLEVLAWTLFEVCRVWPALVSSLEVLEEWTLFEVWALVFKLEVLEEWTLFEVWALVFKLEVLERTLSEV